MTTLKLVMEHQLKMSSPGGKLLLSRVITNGAFRKTITIGSRTEVLKNPMIITYPRTTTLIWNILTEKASDTLNSSHKREKLNKEI